MKRRGFTIIELLVVISIIALLISILLPSLAGARDRARYIRWKGFSHGLRADTEVVSYYNFEEQGEGHEDLWNRAAGDPHQLAREAVEPEDMNARLGRLSSPQTFTDTGVKPEWNLKDARWRGKGSLAFNNSDDEVGRVKNNPVLESLSKSMTVSMWFSPNSSNMAGRRLLEKGNTFFMLNGAGGSGPINFLAKSAQTGGNHVISMTNPTSLEAGQWYLLTGTWDGEKALNGRPALRFWVNDKRNGSPQWVHMTGDEMLVSQEPLWIGTDDNGTGFDGLIDELVFFNRSVIEFYGAEVIDQKVTEMYRVGRPRNKD